MPRELIDRSSRHDGTAVGAGGDADALPPPRRRVGATSAVSLAATDDHASGDPALTATAFPSATTVYTAGGAAATTAGRRRMWAVGAVAGVVSSLLVIALVARAEAAGVPMEVAENSSQQPEHIPLLGDGTVLLGSTLLGLLLATAFARWARRPRRAFVIA